MIKPVSVRLQKRITETGGLAPNGQPLFRVMRGADRFTWIGGKWTHYDANGNACGSHIGVERVLKYPEAKDRYIFEMWMAPEITEEEWNRQFTEWIDGQKVQTLGPYPENGEYELIRVIERVHVDQKTGNVLRKEFVPLTETLCDALVQTAKLNRELPARHRVLAAQERREREEKAKEERQIQMIEDMQRPEWARNPHVIIPDMKEIAQYG
jgi:hypothetical protein